MEGQVKGDDTPSGSPDPFVPETGEGGGWGRRREHVNPRTPGKD